MTRRMLVLVSLVIGVVGLTAGVALSRSAPSVSRLSPGAVTNTGRDFGAPTTKVMKALPAAEVVNEMMDVTLAAPHDPVFRAYVVNTYSTNESKAIQDLEPFVVAVTNNTARSIVGITIEFTTILPQQNTDPDAGGQEIQLVQLRFPDVSGVLPAGGTRYFANAARIKPQQRRLIAPDLDLGPASVATGEPFLDAARTARERRRGRYPVLPEKITVRIDAVLFEDGQLLGADASDLEKQFLTERSSRQEVYREIARDLRNGQSAAEALHRRKPTEAPSLAGVETDLSPIYRLEALADLRRLLGGVGESEFGRIVPALIDRKAFEIRKSPQ